MIKKLIKINLIILIIFFLMSGCLSAFADEQVIEETSELDDLQLQKNGIENEIINFNTQVGFIEDEISSVVFEISDLNQKIFDKQIEIESYTAREDDLVKQIADIEWELEQLNKKYDNQKILAEKRLVAMYEMKDTTYLDVLLNSNGLSEFISNYFLIEEVANTDTELLDTVRTEREKIAKLKDNLELRKLSLIAIRVAKEKDTIALSNMIVIKNNRMKELSDEEFKMQQQIEEYQNELKEIEIEIRLLAIASVSEQYVGGVFEWPVPGYTRITSTFGMRTHPITGIYKLHTGTDVGAPMGANFIAANDGIVVKAGYNGAYGKMVIIDHGGGITTLYAHGSEILVEEGEQVFQGTPVLKVGSTGYSTGPHAHFEIRIDGEYVDPLDYITSYEAPELPQTKNSKSDTEEIVLELDNRSYNRLR